MISPEGCAAILWRSRDHADVAAEALKLTAPDLLELGVIDEVIPEPRGGAHNDPETAISAVGDAIKRNLRELAKLKPKKLLETRRDKYYSMGTWEEA